MAKSHAVLSASSAHRWLNCTPSARLEETLPDSSSEYAEEGTAAHQLAELCAGYKLGLIKKQTYERKFAKISLGKYYTEEMLESCQAYADLIKEKYDRLKAENGDAEILLESLICYKDWAPDGFGTADCMILSDGHLEVIDFKYGKGKRVSAYNNPQMKLYALGAYATYGLVYEPDLIIMTIFQPRIADGVISDKITLEELLDWAETVVKPAALRAYEGRGDFCPGPETCKFCKAKATCRARAEENLKLFDEAPDVMCMSLEEAGEILEKANDIKTWLSDLEKYVFNALMNGDPVKGWKLVEGRSTRRFADTGKVAAAMIEAGYDQALIYKPRELISLTQMEKDFGKKAVADVLGGLIVKAPGSLALAPEYDKRPELNTEQTLLKKFDE